MDIHLPFKKIIIAIAAIASVVALFLVYALAGLNSSPVQFGEPPAFVEQYAREIQHSEQSVLAAGTVGNAHTSQPALRELTTDYAKEEELVRKVFFEGGSLDPFLSLFTHPDKAQRVKIALAFSAVNVEFTHNEESGFPDKRRQFWVDAAEAIPDIRNALFEALIASAKEGTANYIPYTVAWMPGQGEETVEIFAWSAKHHSNWWIRRFSLYFVVEFGGDEMLANTLLSSRTHDPDYRVRREVLDLRINSFKKLFSSDENV